MGSDSRPEDDGSRTVEGAPPDAPEGSVPELRAHGGLRLVRSLPAAFLAVAAAYWRHLWSLLVVVALPALPVALFGAAVTLWRSGDAVVVNGALETYGSPEWVLLGLTLFVALATAPVTLGGAVLVGAGALLGRPVPVGAAWRGALRRYRTTLGWLLLLLLWAAVVLGLLFTALSVLEFTLWPVLTVLVPLVLSSLPALTVALPVALLEGRGTLRALAVSWTMGRYRRASHLVFVALAFGGGSLVLLSSDRLASWAAVLSADPFPSMFALALLSTLAAPLAVLLVTAPVTLDSTGRPWSTHRDLDLAATDRELPRPSPAPRGRAVPALLALAVLVPPTLTPVALWVTDTTRLFTSPAPGIDVPEVALHMTARGDRALIANSGRSTRVLDCDPECAPVGEGEGNREGRTALHTDSGFVFTSWRGDRFGDAAPEPSDEEPGLYLAECSEPDPRACVEEDPGALVRPFGGRQDGLHSAMAPLGEGLVVASRVHPDPDADTQDEGGLGVHVCADTSCADPVPVDVPEDVPVGGHVEGATHLDTASSPEGGFAVTLYDGSFGGVTLMYCADTACADPGVTEVVPASFLSEYEGKFEGELTSRFGARVEYRPDGTPVIAYRVAQGGAAHVVDCHDAACTEFTDRAVTGAGWARPVPGLAVDSRGNPQLVTFDMGAERVVLVSCRDAGCAETVTVPLRPFEEKPALTALTLDETDRPHLVWAEEEPSLLSEGEQVASEYVRCLEPRCGADLGPPNAPPTV